MYLTCLQVLIVWFPNNSGVAVGVGNAAFGLGTVGLTELFSILIARTSHVTAIYLASAILGAGAVLPAMLMRLPSRHEIPVPEEQSSLLQEHDREERLPWYTLARLPNFWFYIFAVFSTSVTYMLNPYYFKLGQLFNRPLDELVLYFNISNLVATFCGLFITALTDVAGFGTGFFFSGSRNIMTVFMMVQALVLLLSIIVNNTLNFTAFVVIKALMKVIVTCHIGCAVLLAKDMFGPVNSCIVFGFGAGLALGSGEAASAWLMATVEAVFQPISAPSDYNAFYWIAAIWSTLGLISVVAVKKHNKSNRYDCLSV